MTDSERLGELIEKAQAAARRFDLTPEDLDVIAGWYYGCARESFTAPQCVTGPQSTAKVKHHFELLEKLGIEADSSDLRIDAEHYKPEYRPFARQAAEEIRKYRERHP